MRLVFGIKVNDLERVEFENLYSRNTFFLKNKIKETYDWEYCTM